jgi:hypothetical protein
MNNERNTKRAINCEIRGDYDFTAGVELPARRGHAYDLLICKTGILAREVSSGYNLFRRWGSDFYLTNCTSSNRFNIENDPITQAEYAAALAALTPDEFRAVLNSDAKAPKGRAAIQ